MFGERIKMSFHFMRLILGSSMVVGFSAASLKLLLVSRLSGKIKVEEKRLRLRSVGEEMVVNPIPPVHWFAGEHI